MAIAPSRRRGGSVLRSEGGQQLRSLDTSTICCARRANREMAAPPGAIEARKIPEEMGTGSASPSKGKGSAARGALPRAIVDSGSRREEWVSFQGTTQFPTSQGSAL